MKRLVILILLLIWGFNLKADTPNIIYTHILVHLKGGEKMDCYFSNADLYLKMDSLSSTKYLTRNMSFNNFIGHTDDSLMLYTSIIRIESNCFIDSPYQHTIIHLIDPFLLPIAKIDSISYLNHESAWGGFSLCNNISISDSSWYNKEPLGVMNLYGSHYEYCVLLYSNDSSLYYLLDLVEKDLKERDKYRNAASDENVCINQDYLAKLNEYEVVIIVQH
jgi:hypothetical protein